MDFMSFANDNMSLWEKLYNYYTEMLCILIKYFKLIEKQRIMDKYFNYTGWETRPPINKLISNRSIVISNKDPVIGYPFPAAPHYKNIGGFSIEPKKLLPKVHR